MILLVKMKISSYPVVIKR